MSKIQIIISASAATILFMTYLLLGILSKISESSKADHSKTKENLE